MNSIFYKYFCVIAEQRSLSKAAEILFLSQPYLSKVLSKIEDTAGVKLIDRSRIPIQLTTAGKLFWEYSKKYLLLEKDMRAELKHLGDLIFGTLVIGITMITGSYLLPLILPLFIDSHPNIKLILKEGSVTELEAMLNNNEIDIAFFVQPTLVKGAYTSFLMNDRIFLVIPPHHKLFNPNYAGKVAPATFDFTELNDCNFILAGTGLSMRRYQNDLFAYMDVKPCIYLESRNIETALRLCLAGVGLTFINEMFICVKRINSQSNYVFLNTPYATRSLSVAYKNETHVVGKFINITHHALSNIKFIL